MRNRLYWLTLIPSLLFGLFAFASPETGQSIYTGDSSRFARPLSTPLEHILPSQDHPDRATPIAPIQIVRHKQWDTVVELVGPIAGPSSFSPKDIHEYLLELGPLLRVEAPDNGWRIVDLIADELGYQHLVLVRTHHGLEVVGSELVLHISLDGFLNSANGRYHPDLYHEAPKPDIAPDGAVAHARQALGASEANVQKQPALVFVPCERTDVPILAWMVELGPVNTPRHPFELYRVFVNAKDGSIPKNLRLNRSSTPQAATGSGTHELGHTVNLNVAHYPSQGIYTMLNLAGSWGQAVTADCANSEYINNNPVQSNSSTFSDQKAVSIHDSLQITLDYYYNTHNRSNWDDRGRTIRANVHFGNRYVNAAWVGSPYNQMIFGDGNALYGMPTMTACVDIVAHEFGHGVVQATVDLEYQYQSGALNEHFADWSAAMVDTQDRWRLGANCASGGRPIRDMGNPGASSPAIPGHMNDYQNLPNTEDGDWGGVHINVGIPNRALYLAAQETSVQKVEKIWYRVLNARHLNTRSQFLDLLRAVLRASGDLYPGDTNTTNALRSAFATVGLGESSSDPEQCPPNSSYRDGFCYCDEGYRPNTTGTGCEPVPDSCPPNSFPQDGFCYCDPGYGPSADGTRCEPLENAGCPPNSHLEGTSCVCDEGYVGNPRHGGCHPSTSDGCPSNSSRSDTGDCVCNPGYAWDPSNSYCLHDGEGCGSETPYGRCSGNTLIYCNTDDPDAHYVLVEDCAQRGLACDLMESGVGHACIPIGECPSNAHMRDDGYCWCNEGYVPNSSGICEPDGCPANSSLGADGRCHCNSGYRPDSDNRGCIATSDCPENASADQEGKCYCDFGYIQDESGQACVPGCPPNAEELSTGGCQCSSGYELDSDGRTCIPYSSSGGTTSRDVGCAYAPWNGGTNERPVSALYLLLAATSLAIIKRKKSFHLLGE